MSDKLDFAGTMAELHLGVTAASIMTDCEKFGMAYGCREDCPQLCRGECEIYASVEEFLKEEQTDDTSTN